MKKLTTSVLAVVLSSSFAMVSAQKVDSTKTQDIEGVVVTALGIKREKKSLGYATQEVKGETVNKNPTTNFLNNLSGQVSGLDIKQGTNFGGSVNITSRGFKSLTGSNQMLFVVDGVPVVNTNINTANQANGRFGYDFGSAASDINPNDIETINILKGAAAAALYGSAAQNGAVMITTKKGKKNNNGIGLEFSSSITMSTIDKSTFPKYQTEYGEGYNGEDSFNGYGNYNGNPSNITAPFGDDASYGPRYDPNLMVYGYGAVTPGSPTFGQATPWTMAKNGPISFFNTASNYTNSLSFNGANDVSSYRFSYSNVNATDILPNSSLIKNNFGGNASYKLTDKLTANISTNYTAQNTTGRNSTGYGDNILANFRQWWPTNIDIREQRAMYGLTQQNFTWNITSPTNLAPQYWDNVYFTRYHNYETDKRERINGLVSLNYDITKNFSILARVGTDNYNLLTEERRATGSSRALFGLNTAVQPSGYAVGNYKVLQRNYDLIGTYKKDITDDLNVTAILGGNVTTTNTYFNRQSTAGGLKVPNYFTIANSSSASLTTIQDDFKQVMGIYAQASLGYKGTYYLDGTIRRDQTTAFIKENSSYYYPSLSASIIFSNLLKTNWLSFGKVRAAYAEVGSDTAANSIYDLYNAGNLYGSNSVYSASTTARKLDVSQQKLKSTEFGIETQFLKNRIGLDATWFRNDAFNQIIALPVSSAAGSLNQFQNAGNMRTEGFELSLNLTPIKSQNFSWIVNANWSNPISKITELTDGTNNILLASLQGNISINAPLGGKYGTIWGSDYVYAPDGQKIIDSKTGAYMVTADYTHDLGSYQADWFGGLRNTINYKNFSLGFLIDWKKGGNVFSLDQYYGYGTGIYADSVGLNDLGNPIRNPVYNTPGDSSSGNVTGPLGGVILPGVIQNPDGSYSANNVRLDKSQSSQLLGTDLPARAFVYDASYVKLREASITYKLSKEALGSKVIQGMSFSLIGSNLWIIHKNLPYADPEAGLTAGNAQGYQSGPMPTTRNFSFNVKVNF